MIDRIAQYELGNPDVTRSSYESCLETASQLAEGFDMNFYAAQCREKLDGPVPNAGYEAFVEQCRRDNADVDQNESSYTVDAEPRNYGPYSMTDEPAPIDEEQAYYGTNY